MLTVIAIKPLIRPETTVSAQQGTFAGIQCIPMGNYFFYWDTRTGDLYAYTGQLPSRHLRAPRKLGEQAFEEIPVPDAKEAFKNTREANGIK